MGALIQFKFGSDGGLELVIHKALWEQLRTAVVAAEAAEAAKAAVAAAEAATVSTAPAVEAPDGSSNFVRIRLERTTGALMSVAGTGGSNQDPCRPFIQFDVP